MNLQRLAVIAAVVATAGGCASGAFRDRAERIDQLIVTARDNGALRCAPVQLAMAESHLDFARVESGEGRYHHANDELEVAEQNAQLAVDRSPRERCNPPEVVAPSDRDGDGLLDPVDDCPDEPEDKDGYQDDDGCPEPDNDADGLADVDDRCPLDPEDADGFEDDDGCPELDNDADGLADKIDQCPLEAEDVDAFEDDDGCPDCDNDGDGVPECPQIVDKCPNKAADTADGCPEYKLVTVTEAKIELKQTVYFETGRATIRPRSFALLNEVAQALEDNDNIQVRIEGHTDSRGRDSYNLRLSQSRAEAVRDYLIGQGVGADRMTAQGFGETVPIANNRTNAGRAQNRRVEFVITNR